MRKKGFFKRAVFTVEAAVIVPFCVTVIALLIGFCYFTHQANWCKGAAYEAALKGVERDLTKKQGKAKSRMDERIGEIPVNAGEIETEVSEGLRVKISWTGRILSDVFGDLFCFNGKVLVTNVDPVMIKQTEFLLKKG